MAYCLRAIQQPHNARYQSYMAYSCIHKRLMLACVPKQHFIAAKDLSWANNAALNINDRFPFFLGTGLQNPGSVGSKMLVFSSYFNLNVLLYVLLGFEYGGLHVVTHTALLILDPDATSKILIN